MTTSRWLKRPSFPLFIVACMGGLLWPCAIVAQVTGETNPDQDSNSAQTAPADNGRDPGSFWMEQKLRLSQDILTGLASGDFDQIGKSAEVMRGLTKVEAFVRREPRGYRDYLRQFELANESLVRNAVDENLEGATLAFNQLTISCVNCHRRLRESD